MRYIPSPSLYILMHYLYELLVSILYCKIKVETNSFLLTLCKRIDFIMTFLYMYIMYFDHTHPTILLVCFLR